MKKEVFNKLDINDRANLVWDKGEFVGHRDYYNHRIALYALPQLFVEVWIFNGKIEKVETIEDTKTLQQYVNAEELLKLLNS